MVGNPNKGCPMGFKALTWNSIVGPHMGFKEVSYTRFKHRFSLED